ncbi:hypothetical protein ACI2L1_41015, partial [Streptomyces sp. NPDC019531]|uniref:hypothetical protein n=1 Tax=Streptomyces sp. NPDC019531 TaxID=3365062 RepID=UPI00384F5D7F
AGPACAGNLPGPAGAGDTAGPACAGNLPGPGDAGDLSGPADAPDPSWAGGPGVRAGAGDGRDRAGPADPGNLPGPADAGDPSGAGGARDRAGTGDGRDRAGTGEARGGPEAGVSALPWGDRRPPPIDPELIRTVPHNCAVDRWAAEARILLGAEGRSAGRVLVRFGGRHRLVLELSADDGLIRTVPTPTAGSVSALPVLPDAATWVVPDLELLRTGAIEADRLHPLVAAALVPDRTATGPPRIHDGPGQQRIVECRGARHRIGLVDGVLAPLDHDPDEIRREELLVALTGTPLPCLQAIDEAHRRPHCLDGVRERLVHGDTAGALAVVEALLGPEALLRTGPLRDELEAAAQRRITYGLFRTGLAGPGPASFAPRPSTRDSRSRRTHPRRTTAR